METVNMRCTVSAQVAYNMKTTVQVVRFPSRHNLMNAVTDHPICHTVIGVAGGRTAIRRSPKVEKWNAGGSC